MNNTTTTCRYIYVIKVGTRSAVTYRKDRAIKLVKLNNVTMDDCRKMPVRQYNECSSWDLPTFWIMSEPF